MRGKSWVILAAAALLALTGIGASTGGKPPGGGKPPPVSQPQQPDRPQPNAAEAARCVTQGGRYVPVCLGGQYQCIVSYRDANRPCTDGSQCQGGACYYGGTTPARNVRGTCVPNSNPCGCRAEVHNGRADGTMCVD